jgi:hypothetical protein
MAETDVKAYLGDGKPLSDWIAICKAQPGRAFWLLAEDAPENDPVKLDTFLFPIVGNTGELTDEEYEELDQSIQENGYCSFLNLDQLEDIIANIRDQRPDYSDAELLEAINYYVERDAFRSW